MKIKKVNINLTEKDITAMFMSVCQTVQSTKKANDITDLFTELLLKSTEASSLFVQVMLGNGLPEALREGDLVRCNWKRLKVGLSDADPIFEMLNENNLLNADEDVVCTIKSFRGYTDYFPYTVEFKYGEDLYASCSMGFEDILT
jgi:hypothetical protein